MIPETKKTIIEYKVPDWKPTQFIAMLTIEYHKNYAVLYMAESCRETRKFVLDADRAKTLVDALGYLVEK